MKSRGELLSQSKRFFAGGSKFEGNDQKSAPTKGRGKKCAGRGKERDRLGEQSSEGLREKKDGSEQKLKKGDIRIVHAG